MRIVWGRVLTEAFGMPSLRSPLTTVSTGGSVQGREHSCHLLVALMASQQQVRIQQVQATIGRRRRFRAAPSPPFETLQLVSEVETYAD